MPTRPRPPLLLSTLLLALAGCHAGGGDAVGGSERLNSTGRWFTDEAGRVVILHGVNVVAKTAAGSPSQQGFGADDAAALAAEGFNAFRLGIYHDVAAPAPGEFNDAYIADVVATAKILSDAGLHVMVDWHQDGFAPSLGGRGLAEWMVVTDGLPSVPSPQFQVNYLQNPALQRAFDNLYANTPAADGTGLADHFAAALARAAAEFRHVPRLLGYDLINEPWPGTPYPSCANPLGCPLFDQMVLAPFYQRLSAAIRQADPDSIIFQEPHVLFSFGADTWLPTPADPQTGFSFHNYCLEPGQFPGLDVFPVPLDAHCSTLEGLVFANAQAYGEQADVALIDSEWASPPMRPTSTGSPACSTRPACPSCSGPTTNRSSSTRSSRPRPTTCVRNRWALSLAPTPAASPVSRWNGSSIPPPRRSACATRRPEWMAQAISPRARRPKFFCRPGTIRRAIASASKAPRLFLRPARRA